MFLQRCVLWWEAAAENTVEDQAGEKVEEKAEDGAIGVAQNVSFSTSDLFAGGDEQTPSAGKQML